MCFWITLINHIPFTKLILQVFYLFAHYINFSDRSVTTAARLPRPLYSLNFSGVTLGSENKFLFSTKQAEPASIIVSSIVFHFEIKNNIMANNRKNIEKSIHKMRVGTCFSVAVGLLAKNIALTARDREPTINPIIIKIISSLLVLLSLFTNCRVADPGRTIDTATKSKIREGR
jgi:hypothetical protein